MSCDWEMARLFLVGADRVTKVPISATDIVHKEEQYDI
ncbi:Uncharacterised protein [Streptococcus pyogenes]|nr:hypothetical protein HMPREF1227_1107 [Streptococcus pyogenes GA41046]SRX86972.1 Uncharacterised protein [Streptococcus pyogenes]SUO83915.1 Uncharacterised protein [Streptococcus pyogenes]VGU36232.1 Uncharacterised protein [Streptococcus pyogenes]VHM34614.1 Uncharacterised protein [Streptococcus pyogenes]